jgi:type IV secretory pathway TraG/TraD family ATPase VirD4
MSTTRVRSGGWSTGSDLALFALVGTIGFAGFGVWLSGQVAGLLFHGTWPETSPADMFTIAFAVPHHLGDPRLAWPESVREQLPGSTGFYSTMLMVYALLAVLGVMAVRWWRGDQSTRGMATPQQVAHTLSERAALRTAKRIRPNLTGKPRIQDVAVPLGTSGRTRLYAGLESSVLLAAAPRQGKTSQVIIPWLRHFPGAAVVTSVRRDVLEATATLRRGTPWVMELTGDLTWPHKLSWSPVAGCQRYDLARKRADVMIQVGKAEGSDSSNSGFFGLTATNLLAAWLHTAALTGKTMADVLRWSTKDSDDEPVTLLRKTSGAREGVLQMMDGFYRQPETTRSNLWTTVQTTTACLFGEAAQAVFCQPVAESFDLEAFLRSGQDTIYLLIDEEQASALAPLVSTFVAEITTTARRLAQNAPTGRLDPPLGMILDEVTNVVPLPDLPQLMSYAAGSGIFVVAVVQNLAAAEHRWRAVGRKMLWANATIKIALGGLAGEDLDAFSHLAGVHRETLLIPQHDHHGSRVQTSVVDRKTMPGEAIRTLSADRRQALVIHATTPPVITRMRRHYEGRDASDYQRAVTEARQMITTATEPVPATTDKETP